MIIRHRRADLATAESADYLLHEAGLDVATRFMIEEKAR